MSNMVLTPLTQEQRLEAQNRAKEAVITQAGIRPTPDQFKNTNSGKYPVWVIRVVVGLAALMLIVAFLPSALRLYHVGAMTFGENIHHGASMMTVGICVVLLAETGSVLFTLAFAVLETSRTSRAILVVSIIATALIALSGNWQIALATNDHQSLFVVLEALAPPLLTLATAYILKEVTLHSIAERHADNLAYEAALNGWQVKVAYPHEHEDYMRFYANALWDALLQVNAKGRGGTERRDYLLTFSAAQKSALVRAEMAADSWYMEPMAAQLPAASNPVDEDTAEVVAVEGALEPATARAPLP